MIRVLVVDDQGLVRAGFRSILEAQPDLQVVGEADDGAGAVDRASALSPDIVLMDVREFVSRPRPGERPRPLADLTEREAEVLRLVAAGRSNADIALEMFLAESTVKTHINRLFAKLGVRDRVQAVVLAYESGFVAPGR